VSSGPISRLSTGELVRRLVDNMSRLVQRELDLARAEARSDLLRVAVGLATLALGLLMLYTFVAALIVAAVYAVATVAPPMPPVYAALVIGGVFLLLGSILGLAGLMIASVRPLERTRRTVLEAVEWARRQVR